MQTDTMSKHGIHRSWPQAIVFVAVWIPIVGALFVAERQALVVLIPVNLVLLYAVGVFVGGFRYYVSSTTLEIRNVFRTMARYRLAELQSSEVVTTNALADWGGWGVRGLGTSKAFLLGGDQALRLRLPDREVFLGLKNAEGLPERVRLLASAPRAEANP